MGFLEKNQMSVQRKQNSKCCKHFVFMTKKFAHIYSAAKISEQIKSLIILQVLTNHHFQVEILGCLFGNLDNKLVLGESAKTSRLKSWLSYM
jgi:hypothetical protein